jgi:hypothetical protein
LVTSPLATRARTRSINGVLMIERYHIKEWQEKSESHFYVIF